MGKLLDIFNEGRKAHNGGGQYSDGGMHKVGSPEEIAWQAGWELDCADQIAEGREGVGAWPAYPHLCLREPR